MKEIGSQWIKGKTKWNLTTCYLPEIHLKLKEAESEHWQEKDILCIPSKGKQL